MALTAERLRRRAARTFMYKDYNQSTVEEEQ
jgi:hypothetical protein